MLKFLIHIFIKMSIYNFETTTPPETIEAPGKLTVRGIDYYYVALYNSHRLCYDIFTVISRIVGGCNNNGIQDNCEMGVDCGSLACGDAFMCSMYCI